MRRTLPLRHMTLWRAPVRAAAAEAAGEGVVPGPRWAWASLVGLGPGRLRRGGAGRRSGLGVGASCWGGGGGGGKRWQRWLLIAGGGVSPMVVSAGGAGVSMGGVGFVVFPK